MDLAQEFLDSYIDYEKREYLRNGKDFMPTFIAFEGEKAWVIPFCTPDREAKDRRLKVLAAAFEAKGIRRYGYIMDVWCAELDPAKFGLDPKTVTREEMEQVRSQYLPEDLANYVERKETLIWGMVSDKGPEYSMYQFHDSGKRELLGAPVSSNKIRELDSRFDKLLEAGKGADFSVIPRDLAWKAVMMISGAQEMSLH